jgi:Kelch motif protein/galactose oxidase-like protein
MLNRRRLAAAAAVVLTAALLAVPAAAAHAVAAAAVTRPAGPPNTWVPTGPMRAPRAGQTATLLPDGKVLVAGGGTTSAELYNPATSTFASAGRLPVAISAATATLLPDGDVLVAGGQHGQHQVASAELYDPATGTWSATAPMTVARSGQTATLLPDGDVLVAGGGCNGTSYGCDAGSFLYNLSSAELYDPGTGTWTRTGSMHIGRQYQTATLLPDGDVLVAGGFVSCDDDFCSDTPSAELYHPATGKWTMTGRMHQAGEQETAALLRNGQVLAAGGYNEGGDSDSPFELSGAELYDPAAGTWSPTAPMPAARYGATATVLGNGWVLLAGGGPVTAEIYQPQRAAWVAAGPTSTTRIDPTATLLPSGYVLLAGGDDSSGAPLSTAELFLARRGPLVSVAPGALAFGGQQVGSSGPVRSYTVTNLGSADLNVAGVDLAGADPGDFRASTGCARAPVPPGYSCQVSVRFAPASTGLRQAVVDLADDAPGTPQPVTVTGYGGGPYAVVPVGPMTTASQATSATLLADGKVLFAGGLSGSLTSLAAAELYDPVTRTFAATGSLTTARAYPAAVRLPDGVVLVAGGLTGSVDDEQVVASAELYDPVTGGWTATTPMNAAGYNLDATLLPDGNVLVTGLPGASGEVAEVYDPGTATWTDTGPLPSGAYYTSATLLQSGEVLVAGGGTAAALYDPASNAWAATGSMHISRAGQTATLLPDGDVLVAGGLTPQVGGSLASAELYDPATGTWSLTSSMLQALDNQTATLLNNGDVLVTGGCSGDCYDGERAVSGTEIYADGYWLQGADMTQPRTRQTATALADGDVLVAGGQETVSGQPTGTADLYTPPVLADSPASGPPGQRVTLAGSGFYAHENVTLSWDGGPVLGRAVTSPSGTFTARITIPQAGPGQHTLTAQGRRSLASAVVIFTVMS